MIYISILIFLLAPTCLLAKDNLWRNLGIVKVDHVEAPNFTLNNIEGKTVSLNGFRGDVVFLNFWATWCAPCKEEMPSMEALHKRYKKRGLSILAISSYERKQKVYDYIKKNSYTFSVLLDTYGSVAKQYKASFVPTTFLIDRSGRIVGKVLGNREWDSPSAYNFIEELINR